MQLREGEQIIKVFHHHPTPFVYDVFKVILGSFPFFLILILFGPILSVKWAVILYFMVFTVFALVLTYVALIYWLDKLIITNHRIIHIDWKYLTMRDESEAFLTDIQDVQTEEKGILARFRVFDYGLLRLDTPSSYVTIEFFHAPDPENIRKHIFSLKQQ